MEKFGCGNAYNFVASNDLFECGTCGNHVCRSKAEVWGRICPHCFGRLYRIS